MTPFNQRGVGRNGAQDIVEIMGDTTGNTADQLQLGYLSVLHLDIPLVGDIADQNQVHIIGWLGAKANRLCAVRGPAGPFHFVRCGAFQQALNIFIG